MFNVVCANIRGVWIFVGQCAWKGTAAVTLSVKSRASDVHCTWCITEPLFAWDISHHMDVFLRSSKNPQNTDLDEPLYHRYVVHQNTQLPNFQCILCCNEVTFPKCVPTPSCACPVSKQSQPLLFPHIIGDQIWKLDLCHNRNETFQPREMYHFPWYPPKKLKYGKPRLGESTLT